MRRAFITFAAGDSYERLADVLRESISISSQYDLITYKPQDFDIKWEPENWQQSYVFIFKVLSCIKSLESYDEVVWLDNDIVVTKNIDKIWDNKIDNYPLLPTERFNNFSIWPNQKPNYQDPGFLGEAKQRIGVVDTDFNNIYLQACCMFFNKNCLYFFNQVLHYYKDFDGGVYPYGDESIINCMIWRDKLTKNLGDVFLCSYYFSPYIIEMSLMAKNADEYYNLFDINQRLNETEDTYILSHGWSLARHNRICLISNNYDNFLFIHGSKSPELHNSFLNLMK